MPTNLLFTAAPSDHRQLRFNGTASLIGFHGEDYSALGAAYASNVSRAIWPSGVPGGAQGEPFFGAAANLSFVSGGWTHTALNLTAAPPSVDRYVLAAGVDGATFGTPMFSLPVSRVLSEWLTTPNIPSYGTLEADTWLKYVTPSYSAAQYGTGKVYKTTIEAVGFTAAQYGSAVIKLNSAFMAGTDFRGLGALTVRNADSYARFSGYAASLFSAAFVAPAVRAVSAQGLDQLEITPDWGVVDNIGNRVLGVVGAPAVDGYGSAYVGQAVQTVTGRGTDLVALGLPEATLKIRTVSPIPPSAMEATAYGRPKVELKNRYCYTAAIASFGAGAHRLYNFKQAIGGTGDVLSAFGAHTTALRDLFIRPTGADWAVAAAGTIYNKKQTVRVNGLEAPFAPAFAVGPRVRALSTVGGDCALYGYPALVLANLALYPVGAAHTEYGGAWVAPHTRSIGAVSTDHVEYGLFWATPRVRTLTAPHYDGLTTGVPELIALRQFALMKESPAAIPIPTFSVADVNRVVRVTSLLVSSFGGTAVQYAAIGPVGTDQSALPTAWVSRRLRSIYPTTVGDTVFFPSFGIHNVNRPLLGAGLSFANVSTQSLVRYLTSWVYPQPNTQDAFGSVNVIGPKWVYQVLSEEGLALGRPTVGEAFDGRPRPYGIPRGTKYGLTYVYNNARKVLAVGDDMQQAPEILSVGYKVRNVQAGAYEKPYASNYTVVYNGAWAIYPAGQAHTQYGVDMQLANLNRSVQWIGAPAPEPTAPFAAYRVRTVYHEDRRGTAAPPWPTIYHKTGYLHPVGFDARREGLHVVAEHFTIIAPAGTPTAKYGTAYLRNNTPEVRHPGYSGFEAAFARVFNAKQFVRPLECATLVSGNAAVSHEHRSITPDSYAAEGHVRHLVYIDELSAPILRKIYPKMLPLRPLSDENPPVVGSPMLYTNVVAPGSITPRNGFGDFTTDYRSILFDASVNMGEENLGASNVVLDMLGWGALRVYDNGPRTLCPIGVQPERVPGGVLGGDGGLQVTPYRIRLRHPADKPEGMLEVGEHEVMRKHRTIQPLGGDARGIGAVTVSEQWRVVRPNPLNQHYFGWMVVDGGARTVSGFDETEYPDYFEHGTPEVTRAELLDRTVTQYPPFAVDNIGHMRVERFHREVRVAGDAQSALPRFVVTPPFFVTPNLSDLTLFGDAFVSPRIRNLSMDGEDLSLFGPDGHNDDGMTVSTPPLRGPTQTVIMDGQFACDSCCWGFYIGNSQ